MYWVKKRKGWHLGEAGYLILKYLCNMELMSTFMCIQSSISLYSESICWGKKRITWIFILLIFRLCTHAGQMKTAAGGNVGPPWRVCRDCPRSHNPSLGFHNCCGASGCEPSSWNPLLNHLYTSVSSTCLWFLPRSAISVNNQSTNKHGEIHIAPHILWNVLFPCLIWTPRQ